MSQTESSPTRSLSASLLTQEEQLEFLEMLEETGSGKRASKALGFDYEVVKRTDRRCRAFHKAWHESRNTSQLVASLENAVIKSRTLKVFEDRGLLDKVGDFIATADIRDHRERRDLIKILDIQAKLLPSEMTARIDQNITHQSAEKKSKGDIIKRLAELNKLMEAAKAERGDLESVIDVDWEKVDKDG